MQLMDIYSVDKYYYISEVNGKLESYQSKYDTYKPYLLINEDGIPFFGMINFSSIECKDGHVLFVEKIKNNNHEWGGKFRQKDKKDITMELIKNPNKYLDYIGKMRFYKINTGDNSSEINSSETFVTDINQKQKASNKVILKVTYNNIDIANIISSKIIISRQKNIFGKDDMTIVATDNVYKKDIVINIHQF